MERDYQIGQAAASNSYNTVAPRAEVVREASMREKAAQAAQYLSEAHAVMDALEDALHGPAPRPALGNSLASKGDPSVPGLRVTLAETATGTAMLLGRLRTLLESL